MGAAHSFCSARVLRDWIEPAPLARCADAPMITSKTWRSCSRLTPAELRLSSLWRMSFRIDANGVTPMPAPTMTLTS